MARSPSESYRADPKSSRRRQLADGVGAALTTVESFAGNFGHALHGTTELGHPADHIGAQRLRLGAQCHGVANTFQAAERAWHDRVTARFPVR